MPTILQATLHLVEPLPVLYWTADIGANGERHFYKDVLERDQKILAALDTPFVLELPIDL